MGTLGQSEAIEGLHVENRPHLAILFGNQKDSSIKANGWRGLFNSPFSNQNLNLGLKKGLLVVPHPWAESGTLKLWPGIRGGAVKSNWNSQTRLRTTSEDSNGLPLIKKERKSGTYLRRGGNSHAGMTEGLRALRSGWQPGCQERNLRSSSQSSGTPRCLYIGSAPAKKAACLGRIPSICCRRISCLKQGRSIQTEALTSWPRTIIYQLNELEMQPVLLRHQRVKVL